MPKIPHQPAKLSVVGFAILLISIHLQQLDSAFAWQSLVPSDTSSPRATLQSFIDACNEASAKIQGDHHFKRESAENRAIVRRILDCIDDSAIPEFERRSRSAEVAVCIKEVLDRVEIPLFSEIPDADEIESSEEDLDRWQIPGTRLTIARIAEGPRKHEYLFSAGTVERAPEYYQEMKQVPYRTTGPATSPGFYEWYMTAPSGPIIGRVVDWLPAGAKTRAGGLAYWQWIGLVLSLTMTVALFVINFRLQRHYSLRFRDDRPYLYCLTIIFPLFAMLIPYWFQHVADEYVSLRGKWLYSATFGANIVALIASVWLVFSAVNRVVAVILASPRINPKGLDAQFIRIVSKILSLAISVLVFIEVGHYLGIPITTLLASAGVGGLAVALAAQDTVKNLFGTILLMADKPFRVGERIVAAGYDGVVENIGLRSTRLRLLTGHQVTIPNDTLACNDVENIGRRPFIRRVSDVHIPLVTPREKIEAALAIIRKALENHEGMPEQMPPRVFFNEFNDDSFNIRIFYWYQPAEYWDFLAFSERLNLEIMRAFEEQQIEFSVPMRVAHATVAGQEEPPLDVRTVQER